jgi:ribonucleoside-diphosphate reductase alpha chain
VKTLRIKGTDFTVPNEWSENAAYIAASRYARNGEASAEDIFRRVSFGIGPDPLSASKLLALQERQIFAFNSPVYFNIGVVKEPILSACFILDVEDNMRSIQDTCIEAWRVFVGGAGIGIDLSPLRESGAPIRGIANASCGPLPLLAKVLDSIGHATRSGGVTRRSAIMLTMADSHPDVLDFIEEKRNTEQLLHKLKTLGIDTADMNNPIYQHIQNQQANRAVRLSDLFMQTVEADWMWPFTSPYDHSIKGRISARQMLRSIARSLWECGDPGIQFTDTINKANPTPTEGTIDTSNPCSEYLYIPNSACNLASQNLLKFYNPRMDMWDKYFFTSTTDTVIRAMDRVIDIASYPTKEIEANCKRLRPLGLGYSNLGSLLMSMGIAYDSDEGRDVAAAITATMTAQAFITSNRLAVETDQRIEDPHIYSVLDAHLLSMFHLKDKVYGKYVKYNTRPFWFDMFDSLASAYGELTDLVVNGCPFHNAVTTLLAPTGTISFLMDCDTTGIEPAYALSYNKQLVGGGSLRQPLGCLETGLRRLDYEEDEIKRILFRVRSNQSIIDLLDEESTNVFATAAGENCLTAEAHIDMIAAVQPFLSGAVSKTVNCSPSTTIEDIERYIKRAWNNGVKAITFYRDESKAAQPLHVSHNCDKCGAEMVSTGTCYACPTCGESSGVCS